MNWFRKLHLLLRALIHRQKLDAEMDEEMRSHIEMRTQANIEAGMNPEEARFAALRQFGWTESIKETCRDQRGVRWLENLVQDIRYGARQLRKNPGFTAVAVLTLAVGIGLNTAVFSVGNAMLLKPLGASRSGDLVRIGRSHGQDQQFRSASCEEFKYLREHASSLSDLMGHQVEPVVLSGTDGSEIVSAEIVAGNYFSMLGARPVLGRSFTLEEDRAPGQTAVASSATGSGVKNVELTRPPSVARCFLTTSNSVDVMSVLRGSQSLFGGKRSRLLGGLVASELLLSGRSVLSSVTAGAGRGGAITLTVGTATFRDGARIRSTSNGSGVAGAITLDAVSTVDLEGSSILALAPSSTAGTVSTEAGSRINLENSRIQAGGVRGADVSLMDQRGIEAVSVHLRLSEKVSADWQHGASGTFATCTKRAAISFCRLGHPAINDCQSRLRRLELLYP